MLTVKSVESVDIATFRHVRRNVYTIVEAYHKPARKENPVASSSANSEPVTAREAARSQANLPRFAAPPPRNVLRATISSELAEFMREMGIVLPGE